MSNLIQNNYMNFSQNQNNYEGQLIPNIDCSCERLEFNREKLAIPNPPSSKINVNNNFNNNYQNFKLLSQKPESTYTDQMCKRLNYLSSNNANNQKNQSSSISHSLNSSLKKQKSKSNSKSKNLQNPIMNNNNLIPPSSLNPISLTPLYPQNQNTTFDQDSKYLTPKTSFNFTYMPLKDKTKSIPKCRSTNKIKSSNPPDSLNSTAYKPNNTNANTSTSYIYSSADGYWQRREIEMQEKMNKLRHEKYEREEGQLRDKPQISKRSQEIVNKMKTISCDQVFDRLSNGCDIRRKNEELKIIERSYNENRPPVINLCSQKINRTVDDLLQWKNVVERKRTETMNYINNASENNVQAPKICRKSENILRDKKIDYLNKKVEDRLLEQGEKTKNKIEEQKEMYLEGIMGNKCSKNNLYANVESRYNKNIVKVKDNNDNKNKDDGIIHYNNFNKQIPNIKKNKIPKCCNGNYDAYGYNNSMSYRKVVKEKPLIDYGLSNKHSKNNSNLPNNTFSNDNSHLNNNNLNCNSHKIPLPNKTFVKKNSDISPSSNVFVTDNNEQINLTNTTNNMNTNNLVETYKPPTNIVEIRRHLNDYYNNKKQNSINNNRSFSYAKQDKTTPEPNSRSLLNEKIIKENINNNQLVEDQINYQIPQSEPLQKKYINKPNNANVSNYTNFKEQVTTTGQNEDNADNGDNVNMGKGNFDYLKFSEVKNNNCVQGNQYNNNNNYYNMTGQTDNMVDNEDGDYDEGVSNQMTNENNNSIFNSNNNNLYMGNIGNNANQNMQYGNMNNVNLNMNMNINMNKDNKMNYGNKNNAVPCYNFDTDIINSIVGVPGNNNLMANRYSLNNNNNMIMNNNYINDYLKDNRVNSANNTGRVNNNSNQYNADYRIDSINNNLNNNLNKDVNNMKVNYSNNNNLIDNIDTSINMNNNLLNINSVINKSNFQNIKNINNINNISPQLNSESKSNNSNNINNINNLYSNNYGIKDSNQQSQPITNIQTIPLIPTANSIQNQNEYQNNPLRNISEINKLTSDISSKLNKYYSNSSNNSMNVSNNLNDNSIFANNANKRKQDLEQMMNFASNITMEQNNNKSNTNTNIYNNLNKYQYIPYQNQKSDIDFLNKQNVPLSLLNNNEQNKNFDYFNYYKNPSNNSNNCNINNMNNMNMNYNIDDGSLNELNNLNQRLKNNETNKNDIIEKLISFNNKPLDSNYKNYNQ